MITETITKEKTYYFWFCDPSYPDAKQRVIGTVFQPLKTDRNEKRANGLHASKIYNYTTRTVAFQNVA